MTLVEDERLRRQLTHSVFFAFEGWGDDPREVHEILACRRYLQALHAQFPYWLHFLAPVPDMWGVLLLCLLEPDGDSVTLMPGSNRRARSCDPDAVNRLLQDMIRPLQLLHEHMALTQEQGEAILEQSLAAIRGTMSL